MKVLSNLGIICLAILGCNVSYATSFNSSECHGSDISDNSNKSNLPQVENWYAENGVRDEYKGLRPDSSYKAVDISKLSRAQSNVSNTPIPPRNLTASDAVIFDVKDKSEEALPQPDVSDEEDLHSDIAGFFKKHPNPEYLVIFECDGITQTMHALNAEKALTNIYWSYNKDLGVWRNVNKWIGISYGCTLAGANVGILNKSKTVSEFGTTLEDIFNHLKEDRRKKSKWYSPFTNCLFNGCMSCAKLKAENEDIAVIKASQFDRISSKAVQSYIANYFPQCVDTRLVFLQSGKDRRRVDPDYQKSYMSIIDIVNRTAKANEKTAIRKNLGEATNIVATVVDTVNIPVAGKIISGVGQLVTKDIKFKTIDDTEHCDAYRNMSNEVLDQGTLKLIVNIDNYDGDDIEPNLQIEHKPQDNKLKYRLTVNIPSLSYQDKKYDFNRGYYRILDYLNSDQVLQYLTPLFEFIHNMETSNAEEASPENNV